MLTELCLLFQVVQFLKLVVGVLQIELPAASWQWYARKLFKTDSTSSICWGHSHYYFYSSSSSIQEVREKKQKIKPLSLGRDAQFTHTLRLIIENFLLLCMLDGPFIVHTARVEIIQKFFAHHMQFLHIFNQRLGMNASLQQHIVCDSQWTEL